MAVEIITMYYDILNNVHILDTRDLFLTDIRSCYKNTLRIKFQAS